MSKRLTRSERISRAKEVLDTLITPEILEEARALQKQMTRSHPEDYWRKLRS